MKGIIIIFLYKKIIGFGLILYLEKGPQTSLSPFSIKKLSGSFLSRQADQNTRGPIKGRIPPQKKWPY